MAPVFGVPLWGVPGRWCGTCVSGFLAAAIARFCLLHGGACGVCGLGLLFENYIVDASIFYKEAISKIMNLDLCCCAWCAPSGVWCVWWWQFSWFSRKLAFLIFCGQVFKSTRWMPWH